MTDKLSVRISVSTAVVSVACKSVNVWLTRHDFNLLQVLLNEDGTFQCDFSPRFWSVWSIPLLAVAGRSFLHFDTNKHLREQITFQLLPCLSVFTHSHISMQ